MPKTPRIMLSLSCLFVLLSSACVVKTSQVVTDLRPTAGKPVEAKAGGVGVLHLTVPKLQKKVESKLLEQCAGGEVVNVNSQLTRREFFIVQYYSLQVTGECKYVGFTSSVHSRTGGLLRAPWSEERAQPRGQVNPRLLLSPFAPLDGWRVNFQDPGEVHR